MSDEAKIMVQRDASGREDTRALVEFAIAVILATWSTIWLCCQLA